MEDHKNALYYGDNLDMLSDRRYFASDSVDLIYLDPPFNSNADYNVVFKEGDGSDSVAEIKAFSDTWHWDAEARKSFLRLSAMDTSIAKLLSGLREVIGENDLMAYLVMMASRLVELHRILKQTGSLYLHCDPTASHYLKISLDSIFGRKNFMNEIIWDYGPKATQHGGHFQRKHDVLLFYRKGGPNPTFNEILQDYSAASLAERDTRYKFKDEQGVYRLTTRRDTAGNKYRAKVYLNEGVLLHDVWRMPIINATSKERLGYPTQKPESLLERIILASSNEGDIVLDPFCGCGTAIAVAERLNRHWIGIDVTHLAIGVIKKRMNDTFGDKLRPYEEIGRAPC